MLGTWQSLINTVLQVMLEDGLMLGDGLMLDEGLTLEEGLMLGGTSDDGGQPASRCIRS